MKPEIREQILRRIDSYDGSINRLRMIVNELDAIWNAEDWRPPDSENMRSAWGVLELIYSVAVVHHVTTLDANEQSEIKEALTIIRPIIQKGP